MDGGLVEALHRVRAVADAAVIAFDFDGTLAPVVPSPPDARATPEAVERLAALTASYRRVAVVSGRPVAFLAAQLPPAIDLIGLYGLERRQGGAPVDHPDAARWRQAVARAVAAAGAAAAPDGPLAGLVVEDKGLSLTLHVRTRPELETEAGLLAARLGAETGLQVRSAKRSFELHPPVAVDKGTVLEELAVGASAVVYVGDDVGDLPAFDALDRLSAAGVTTVAVVVGGPELPASLADRGGVHVLAGQHEVVGVLAALGA